MVRFSNFDFEVCGSWKECTEIRKLKEVLEVTEAR